MAEIGWASLGIIPSFRGFASELERGTSKHMLAAGAKGGSHFGDAAGKSAGGRFARGFSSTVKRVGLFGGLGVGLGLGNFVKDAVGLEAEYGKTMAQIRVATAAPVDQLERLDDLAIKLGKDTVFSASDASSAMLELAKNGIKPATIEAGALDSALTLAAAGGVDMTAAATTMGNALNAFGLKGRQARRVAAALAGAANASSASVDSLAQGLQQSAATANDVGFSVQETTGILAAFANAGISGSDAGTSLKTMLTRLLPATNKARKEMEKYGISFVQANGEFKSATEIADILHDKLGELSASERSAALETMFGSDARRAATVLVKEGERGLRNYIRATSDQEAAEKMAKASMEGTAGAIEELAGSWETTKLEFGKAIAPVAVDFLDTISDKLDTAGPKLAEFGTWFAEKGLPAAKEFGGEAAEALGTVRDVLKPAAKHAANLVEAFNDMPDWAKTAIVGGGASLMVGSKLGLGSLGKKAAGSLVSSAKPIPVFVVNEGFGGDGAMGGKKGWMKSLAKWGGPAAAAGFLASADAESRARGVDAIAGGSTGVGGSIGGIADEAKRLDELLGSNKKRAVELNTELTRRVKLNVDNRSAIDAITEVRRMADNLRETIRLLDVRARGAEAAYNRKLYGDGSGQVVNFNIAKVEAKSGGDLMDQLRSRAGAAVGGTRGGIQR